MDEYSVSRNSSLQGTVVWTLPYARIFSCIICSSTRHEISSNKAWLRVLKTCWRSISLKNPKIEESCCVKNSTEWKGYVAQINWPFWCVRKTYNPTLQTKPSNLWCHQHRHLTYHGVMRWNSKQCNRPG